MNCYNVQNPTNGQSCNDDVLGNVVFNAADGTWEKTTGYASNNNSISFDLSTLPGNQSKGLASIGDLFKGQYGVLLIGAIVFVGVIIVWNLFGKAKK